LDDLGRGADVSGVVAEDQDYELRPGQGEQRRAAQLRAVSAALASSLIQ
jgi:hypothetical protein